jgi:hypothetical protein
MKLYRFNYFFDHQLHSGEQWALSKFDVERSITSANRAATGIYVWME